MRKIKKRSKRHPREGQPSPTARIIKNAIETGKLDIMSLDLKNIPDATISAMVSEDHESFLNNRDLTDAAIIIYDRYLVRTKQPGISEKDVEKIEHLAFHVMIHAVCERAKRTGFIKSYKTEPHIFDPKALISCDFGDNKFFQGAEAFRLIREQGS